VFFVVFVITIIPAFQTDYKIAPWQFIMAAVSARHIFNVA